MSPTANAAFLEYTFDSNSNHLKWVTQDPNVKLSYSDQRLALNSNSAFPFIVSPPLLFYADDTDTFIIKMKSSKPGTATVFFSTDFDPQLNNQKAVNFQLARPGKFNTYYINLRQQHPAWTSRISRLAFSPFQGSGQAQVDYIKLTKANLFTNLLAGWQEFWGPKGRQVIGSTINVIPSSTLWSKPINLYVYWIIGLIFIGSLGYCYLSGQKQKPSTVIRKTFHKAVRITLTGTIIFWIILSLNADYNFFNIFKNNLKPYFGKTIEGKRAVAYGVDFYEFLKFTKNQLPKKPVKFGLLTSNYAPFLQTRIYLFPHHYEENFSSPPPYLLIFRPTPTQTYNKNLHTPYAQLNDQAYILKRIKP